jgi:maleate cis-trans isomerase
VRRVAVVTPYVELTNERLKQFLQHYGIDVVRLQTFDMLDMFDHAKITPQQIYHKSKEIDGRDIDAIFVACTQLRALEVIDMLERDLGKRVYSAIQATAWQAYKALRIDPQIANRGSLLRSLGEGSKAANPAMRISA